MMRHGEESQSTPHLAADRAEEKNQPTAVAYDARDSRQRLDGAILASLIMPHLAYLAVVTLLFGPLNQSAEGNAILALAFIIRPLLAITVVFATRCLQEQGKGLGYDFKGLYNPVVLGLAIAVWYWIHFWIGDALAYRLSNEPLGDVVFNPGFVLLDFAVPLLVLGGWFAWRTRVIESNQETGFVLLDFAVPHVPQSLPVPGGWFVYQKTDDVVSIHWLSHLIISALWVVVMYAVLLVPMCYANMAITGEWL